MNTLCAYFFKFFKWYLLQIYGAVRKLYNGVQHGFNQGGYPLRNKLFSFITSTTLVALSLFLPSNVQDLNELQSVEFGYPFYFIVQDKSSLTPPLYPSLQNFGSPLEYPTQFVLLNCLLSITIVWILVISIKCLIKKYVLCKNIR